MWAGVIVLVGGVMVTWFVGGCTGGGGASVEWTVGAVSVTSELRIKREIKLLSLSPPGAWEICPWWWYRVKEPPSHLFLRLIRDSDDSYPQTFLHLIFRVVCALIPQQDISPATAEGWEVGDRWEQDGREKPKGCRNIQSLKKLSQCLAISRYLAYSTILSTDITLRK